MALLQVHNLAKSFAGRQVVAGVSFEVGHAEVVGLLGRNGAGKTTSFRMAIGMIDADAGRVLFDNQDISTLPMFRRARLGMGYLSQEPSVFQRLTCEQNLLAILETLPIGLRERKRRAAALLEQFHLSHKAKQQARTCSGGERRKLEIARALVTQPKLILLDEPFSGVDPIAVEELQAEIRRLAAAGIACLVTDHNVQQTLRVCDRAYIIDEGKKFAEGTPRDLINNDLVKRVYLGSLFRGDEFDDHPRRSATPGSPSSVSGLSGAAPSSTSASSASGPVMSASSSAQAQPGSPRVPQAVRPQSPANPPINGTHAPSTPRVSQRPQQPPIPPRER